MPSERETPATPEDARKRPLRSLRISVTDRCNLRCRYCMPEREYVWLPRESILRFEEIERLARVFAAVGVTRLRLTGGEPLLRRDLDTLVRLLAGIPEIDDIALTTNGVLLADQAATLRRAGLHRVTVSLDTLRPDRFRDAAGNGNHDRVLRGIAAAHEVGFEPLKLNSVVVRGFNDDELVDLVEFARRQDAEVRFIEYMDVGGANQWSMERVVPRDEILEKLQERYGPIASIIDSSPAPADRYRLADGTRFGIIASTTAPFCGDCDRARLTADGHWLLCLYARDGNDLRSLLRSGATDDDIAARIRNAWKARDHRGAEERLGISARRPLHEVEELRRDPHLEMHTRGG
jgi:cyclic pyranopterin phosphate synthase